MTGPGPDDSIRVTAGRPHDTGSTGATSGGSRGGKGLPVPSELLVLALLSLALLIAAALADNFDSPVAWGFVTLLGFAYILSRGITKRGTGRGDDGF